MKLLGAGEELSKPNWEPLLGKDFIPGQGSSIFAWWIKKKVTATKKNLVRKLIAQFLLSLPDITKELEIGRLGQMLDKTH